ncbi:MAG: PQQ-like beta-propeller repeat protein [Rickettsiales bacterium]|nr:PQQ-like beta-propeller repeat protein [Rickettsiales bacterium]
MLNNRTVLVLLTTLLLGACDVPDWMGNEEAKEKKLPGERISVLDFESGLEADESLEDEKILISDPERNPDFKFDVAVQLAGYENLAITGIENRQEESAGDGAPFKTILVSPPIVADGKVFAIDAQGYVSAHNAADIDEIYWISNVPVTFEERDIGGGGLAYDKGVVYVTTGYGATIALVAADGSLLWRRDVDAPVRAAPLVADGKVFTISIDNQLFAYNARTGSTLWNHRGIRESAVYLGSVSPSFENGIVVAAYTTGEIYALRAEDGSPIWSDALVVSKRTSAASTLTGIDATPVLNGGLVYGLSNSGLLSANLLSNGHNVWEHEIAGYSTPWAAGGYVFVLTNDERLMAIRGKDGAIKWITRIQDPEEDEPVKQRLQGPIMINSRLVVVSDLGRMFLFDPQTGKPDRVLDIPEDVHMAPIVADGKMYLLSADATLYRYQ